MIIKPAAYHWGEMKIGPGAPPFRTEKDWLHMYHGVFKTMSGSVYRLGAILNDIGDPATVIGLFEEHEALVSWLDGLSLLMFVGSMIAVPMVIVQLPEDYLRRNHKLILQHLEKQDVG